MPANIQGLFRKQFSFFQAWQVAVHPPNDSRPLARPMSLPMILTVVIDLLTAVRRARAGVCEISQGFRGVAA